MNSFRMFYCECVHIPFVNCDFHAPKTSDECFVPYCFMFVFRIFKILLSSLEKYSGNGFKELSKNAKAFAFTLLKRCTERYLRMFKILMNGMQMLRKCFTTFLERSLNNSLGTPTCNCSHYPNALKSMFPKGS